MSNKQLLTDTQWTMYHILGNKSSPTADCTDPDLLLHNAMADLDQCSLLGVISRTISIDSDLHVYYAKAYHGLCCLQSDLTYENKGCTAIA